MACVVNKLGNRGNHPEGKAKAAHNRHAGHAKAIRAMGQRSARRKVNRTMQRYVEERSHD